MPTESQHGKPSTPTDVGTVVPGRVTDAIFGGQALALMDTVASGVASRYVRRMVVRASSEMTDSRVPVREGSSSSWWLAWWRPGGHR
jgi:acyl-CoA hydrolase